MVGREEGGGGGDRGGGGGGGGGEWRDIFGSAVSIFNIFSLTVGYQSKVLQECNALGCSYIKELKGVNCLTFGPYRPGHLNKF